MRSRAQHARFFSVAALAGSVFVVGCSAIVDFDALVGPNDAATGDGSSGAPGTDGSASTDGPTGDAAAAPDGTDGTAPDTHVGPNLISNGTFETGCAPWGAFQGTIVEDSTARTGSKSCRICTKPTTTDYFTAGDGYTAGPPIVGATYHGVAWVRTAPGAATPPGIYLHMRTSNATPTFVGLEGPSTPDPGIPIDATWKKIELTMKPTMAAQQMDIFIGSVHQPNVCFLLDDVWFEKVP